MPHLVKAVPLLAWLILIPHNALATAATQTLSLATARFPLAKLPTAMIGPVAGGQSGVRVTSSLFNQWLPPGAGTLWLWSGQPVCDTPVKPLSSVQPLLIRNHWGWCNPDTNAAAGCYKT